MLSEPPPPNSAWGHLKTGEVQTRGWFYQETKKDIPLLVRNVTQIKHIWKRESGKKTKSCKRSAKAKPISGLRG